MADLMANLPSTKLSVVSQFISVPVPRARRVFLHGNPKHARLLLLFTNENGDRKIYVEYHIYRLPLLHLSVSHKRCM